VAVTCEDDNHEMGSIKAEYLDLSCGSITVNILTDRMLLAFQMTLLSQLNGMKKTFFEISWRQILSCYKVEECRASHSMQNPRKRQGYRPCLSYFRHLFSKRSVACQIEAH
jgi:hypothetical protein